MNYIEIVDDAIQYIESNLQRKLTLEDLAARYHISPTHFFRIFQALTNQTVKAYILGRKLSEAAIALRTTGRNVVDVAFQYGFNSHEQFTRDFKKLFHVTPVRYRKERVFVPLIETIDVLERDFTNKKEGIIVDHSCQDLKEIGLMGMEVSLNLVCPCENDEPIRKVYDFYEMCVERGTAKQWFCIGCWDSHDPSRLFCFYGVAAEEYSGKRSGLKERIIPESRYAVFVYPGSMGAIFQTAIKDLDKWFAVSGHSFNHNAGFNYFELFPQDYRQAGKFYLHIPVL